MSDSGNGEKAGYRISDPEQFARNMMRLLEDGGKMFSNWRQKASENGEDNDDDHSLSHAVDTLGMVAQDWLRDPRRAVQAQADLWQNYLNLWSHTMHRFSGAEKEPEILPEKGDRRFEDPEWSENPYFDFVKQAYLMTARWAEQVVENTENMDEQSKAKADFFVKQISNALSPTNFVPTNPELLRETLASNGENLVRGMELLKRDLERGKGKLKVSQTDFDAFKLGENIGATPGKVVFQNDLFQLIQYAPATEQVYKRPLLITPPWINKFYILDLTQEKSFVKWCTEQGHTVFIISWVNPDASLAEKTFEDYMHEGILAAIDAVTKITGEDKINAIGYCIGGTLLTATLAYMKAIGDARVACATFFTAQIDFTKAGDLKVFMDEAQIDKIAADMKKKGFMDGSRMYSTFNMLRSNDLIWPYVINNYLKGQAPMAFDLLYWNSDSTHLPAANHTFYLRNLCLHNELIKGLVKFGGKALNVASIDLPIYNLACREDHIALAHAVFDGCRFLGDNVRFVLAGSGHIAGVVNPPVKNKYQYWTGKPDFTDFRTWIEEAEEHPGSWWVDWQNWISQQGDTMVPARKKLGGGKFKPIEDAPGSYVRVRD